MRNILRVALCILVLAAVSPLGAERVLLSESEDIPARNVTTRVFQRTYEIPILSPDGTPTGRTVEDKRLLVEKADGLCYDAALNTESDFPGDPQWEPADTTFVPDKIGGWTVRTGVARVRIAPQADARPLVQYEVPWRAPNPDPEDEKRPFVRRRVSLNMSGGALEWFDPQSGRSAPLEAPRPVPGRAEGNRVLFENAYSFGHLEFVYEKGVFHQNVIITNPPALNAPGSLGLDPAHSELRVVTDMADATDAAAKVSAPAFTSSGDWSFRGESGRRSASLTNRAPGPPPRRIKRPA